MKKATTILLLSFVIFVSGCITNTQNTPSGNGIVITNFEATNNNIEGKGRSTTINIVAENQGNALIEHAKVCLIGSNFYGESEEGMWERAYPETQKICQTKENLKAYDTENNLPGGTISKKWKLLSPCLPSLIKRADEFTGRVFYDYKTKLQTTIWVYSENEIVAAKQRGEQIPSELLIEKTLGPIDMDIHTVQPVRMEDESFTLKLTFSNVGGGTVFTKNIDWSESDTVPSIDESRLNIFSAKIEAPSGIDVSECQSELNEIELRKGQTLTTSCDIVLPPGFTTTKKSFPITITSSYGYYIDKSIIITVSGKRNQACGSETSDTTAPSAITDLAVQSSTSNSITLTWTAPGDDGNTGKASQYDVRYSTSEINNNNWDSALQASDEPKPSTAGTTEKFTVTGLSPKTTYYFAVKSVDEVPNWSGLSNVVSGTTN